MDTAITPVIEIAQGRLSGLVKDGIQRFNGIPFAKAKRWQRPEPADPWSGVRDATRFGAIAPQIASASEGVLGGTPGEQHEDCLFLNIWTPACDGGKRPVMVWIHGGAFVTGAGSVGTYNGKHLAARGDVVVVTINYRLGVFGFLNLHDASGGKAPGSGTEGIADQIEALRWVKENIAQFGGDPGNVTIFGESAGGMSVGALLAAPAARGLFHKAVPQSGAADIGMARERSAELGHLVLAKLGVDAQTALSLSGKTILDAQAALLAEPRATGALPFGPTVDGDILPKRGIEMVRAGNAAGVPVMTGSTRDEWKLFSLQMNPLTEERLGRYIAARVGDEGRDTMLAVYGEGALMDRWNAFMTDHTFMVPATRLLDAQAPHAPTYLYRFDWPSPALGGKLGACHAIEIGFMFGTYNDKTAAAFFGKGEAADAVAAAMMDSWIAFARTGNPASAATGDWPRYQGSTRAAMIFGDGAPHIANAPNEARRKAWESVPGEMIGA
ncbi:MAG TPA: carboxylesterase/lipase family protein [Rhizomicrobium sp.]|jgi:para-nitrobenzyl esterase